MSAQKTFSDQWSSDLPIARVRVARPTDRFVDDPDGWRVVFMQLKPPSA